MLAPIALRWSARIWGVASTLMIPAFLFGGRERFQPTRNEMAGLLLFPGGVMMGFVIAWRELAGGLITVSSLLLFHTLMFANSGKWWLGPYFLLFAAPGFLHIAAALLSSSRFESNE